MSRFVEVLFQLLISLAETSSSIHPSKRSLCLPRILVPSGFACMIFFGGAPSSKYVKSWTDSKSSNPIYMLLNCLLYLLDFMYFFLSRFTRNPILSAALLMLRKRFFISSTSRETISQRCY
ncbi:hypothetical protein ACFFRR_001692 [Megaselia abdita]